MPHPLDSLITLMQTPRLHSLRSDLCQLLGTPQNSASVYFVVSLPNLQAIIASGEIKPRSLLTSIPLDLSSASMQDRRLKVFLGRGEGAKPNPPINIHECLNFFWNPLNATFDGFCRNSLIEGGEGVRVAILEIPLASLVALTNPNRVTWASSKHNLASPKKNRHTSAPDQLEATDWPWREILSTDPQDRFSNPRKAEFICHVADGAGGTAGIPFAAVSRCSVSSSACAAVLASRFPVQVAAASVFKTPADLLKKDREFSGFFEHAWPGETRMSNILKGLENICTHHQISVSVDDFSNSQLGGSFIHGVPHVSRVMFWAYFLAAVFHQKHTPHLPLEQFIGDCVWAASIHDLCRVSNQEDEIHGQDAAEKFAKEFKDRCGTDALRVKHALEAVAFHCRPVEDYTDATNIIYKVLKDADALDRGRFARARPCSGTDYSGTGCTNKECPHKGCAYKTLRFFESTRSPKREDSFRNLGWAAYNLAQGTKFAPWTGKNAHLQLISFIRNAQTALAAA